MYSKNVWSALWIDDALTLLPCGQAVGWVSPRGMYGRPVEWEGPKERERGGVGGQNSCLCS